MFHVKSVIQVNVYNVHGKPYLSNVLKLGNGQYMMNHHRPIPILNEILFFLLNLIIVKQGHVFETNYYFLSMCVSCCIEIPFFFCPLYLNLNDVLFVLFIVDVNLLFCLSFALLG